MSEVGIMGLMDLGLKITVIIVMWLIGAGFLNYVITEPQKAVDRVRKDYEERVKVLRQQLKDYRERIQFLQQKHKDELRQYAKVNKMLVELKKAVDAGAVQLKCPKHPRAEVTVLADGTIVCSKGHRLWPPEEEESPQPAQTEPEPEPEIEVSEEEEGDEG